MTGLEASDALRPLAVVGRKAQPSLWPAPLVTAALYLLVVVPRLRANGPFWFVHLGTQFVAGAQRAHANLPAGLHGTSRIGYDGQFYFALAADPAKAHTYITQAEPGYVYSRVLYPALARLLGLGRVEGIAYALVGINVAAVVLGTLAAASWLRRRDCAPAYALLFGLFPGLVFCVERDLTEPLAYALAAAAVLVFDRGSRRAVAGAATLMALSVLTRETAAIFALVLAARLVAGDRRVRRGALFLAASVGPLLVWRLAVTLWLGRPTQEQPGGGLASLIPFHAYWQWWPWQPMRTIVVLAVTVPALLTAAAVLAAWRSSRERWPFALFLLNALAFVAFLPTPVFVDYGAAGRAALGVVLAFVFCLPELLRRPLTGRLLAAAWSPACYAAAAIALGAPPPYPLS